MDKIRNLGRKITSVSDKIKSEKNVKNAMFMTPRWIFHSISDLDFHTS